ncbi:hemolysin family protein [Planococcus sp. YIM B11945]|uniref:hemolysin family protein n=1 Tax=Planococcus sp. YIM B11945 TaxID=3435410 RepID=UPI003D7E033D
MDLAISLIVFAALIATTAFFSASEFAIVKVRPSRIDELAEDGHKNAAAAKRVVSNVDDYLFACQIGIALSVLGLGWLGHAAIESLIYPLAQNLAVSENAASLLSFLFTFSALALILAILGEVAPKIIAVQKSEAITLANANLLVWSYHFFAVFIWLLTAFAELVSNWFGSKPVSQAEVGHTEEELKTIMADSFKTGKINSFKYAYVNKIFEFDTRLAKEIMVPRTEMITLDKSLTLQEVVALPDIEQYTRYPVIDGDKDHIVGVVNMKHLLSAYVKNAANRTRSIALYIQPVIQVIDAIPVNDLLLKIQRERIHMAILRDEYGGTCGLVTIEDIIEEIVGEIQDEFDYDEIPEVQKIGEANYVIDAKMRIASVNHLLNIDIEEEDIDTIGGWFMSKSFDTLKEASVFEQGYEFSIKDIQGHHILYLAVHKIQNSTHIVI